MFRSLLFIAIVTFVTGCATQAEMRAQAIDTNTSAATTAFNQCVRNLIDSKEFEPIRENVPYNPLEATLQQLADTAKATKQQVAAILTVHPRYQQCRSALQTALSSTTPTIVPIIVSQWTQNDANLVLVVQRKISWGNYVQRLRDLFVRQGEQMIAEYQRIGQGLQQSHEAELENRRRAFQALADYAQQQQIIDNMRRPSRTNCTTWQNHVNCVTTH
jgi:hypothetical protein